MTNEGVMEKDKLKIFVSAYACEPGLGSEIGVGWNCGYLPAKVTAIPLSRG